MALIKISNPPTELQQAQDWSNLVQREGYDLLGSSNGMEKVTLTNWNTNTTKPTVAKGSIIEVGGTLYQADSDTDITSPSTNDIYTISFTPTGDGSELVASYVLDTSPYSWDAEKIGWYNGLSKITAHRVSVSGSTYSSKSIYQDINRSVFDAVDGSMQMKGNITVENDADIWGSVTCRHIDTGNGITDVYLQDQNIRSFDDVTFNNTNLSSLTLYNTSDGLRPVSKHSTQTLSAGQVYTVPVGVYMMIHGGNLVVEKRDNGSTWHSLGNYKGTLFSDGSDLRLTNAGSSVVVNFWRL